MIADNYATHRYPDFHGLSPLSHALHAYRLPVAEHGGALLSLDLTENRLRRGVFRSVEELITAIFDYIDHHNDNPKTLHLDRQRPRYWRRLSALALRFIIGNLHDALHSRNREALRLCRGASSSLIFPAVSICSN